MIRFVEPFTSQLLDALDRVKNIKNVKPTSPITRVVISGLGGSGIGGSFIQDYLMHLKCKTPIIVNKDYDIPAYVDSSTLFIACSYSGNTEETLEATAKAIKQKAQICAVTSGGKLLALAQKKNYNCIELPVGFPPRASFAYGLVSLLTAIRMHGIIKDTYTTALYETVGMINEATPTMRQQAKLIAKKLVGQHIVLYAASGNEAITVRFRQQLNENSKVLALHHIYPEMNHNELVGWRTKGNYTVINLFTGYEHKRSLARFEITKPMIKKYAKTIIDVHAQGETWLACSVYLVHLGDLISCELATFNKVDSIEVKVIDTLKNALSKID
jgi:glucose/mannose-6-phosphate isomerase